VFKWEVGHEGKERRGEARLKSLTEENMYKTVHIRWRTGEIWRLQPKIYEREEKHKRGVRKTYEDDENGNENEGKTIRGRGTEKGSGGIEAKAMIPPLTGWVA
jgi:hypothetical protein